MAEFVSDRSSTYKILGWICFALGLLVTPIFGLLGIVMGIAANAKERGKGTAVIWANTLMLVIGLIVTLLFYGVAGLAFFTILRGILGV